MQYQVGGHFFTLCIPPGMIPEDGLVPYLPFRVDENEASASLFTLSFVKEKTLLPTETELIASFTDDEGITTKLFHAPGGTLFHFALARTRNLLPALHHQLAPTRHGLPRRRML